MNGTPQRLVVADSGQQSSRGARSDQLLAWSVLGISGFLFFMVGALDVLLVWYPLNFGVPDWEFFVISASLNGLPAPTIGLALMGASAVAHGHLTRARVCAALLGLISVLVVVLLVIFATNVPIALKAQVAPGADVGVKKAIVKVAGQALFYPVFLAWIAKRIWTRGSRA